MDISWMNAMGMQMMMNPMMSMMMTAMARMQLIMTQPATTSNPQTHISIANSPSNSQSLDPFQPVP
jgi:hypothetical protein